MSKAVEEGVGLVGRIDKFVKSGERIVMKPNVLVGTNPDKCVTTHPTLMIAMGQLLQKAGCDVYYGDSSSFGSAERNMRRAGFLQAAEAAAIKLADFDNGRLVVHKEAKLSKHLFIANGVLDTDGLVSLSKMKTHAMVRFTGAVKNQFGCISGLQKTECHVRMPDPYDFAAMLVDINTFIKPRLYIMDGIMAMDGNGPRSGNPRKMGVLLFSSDPVALDSVACKMIALEPDCVPTLAAGEIAGLGTYHFENIEIVGEDVESFVDKDFNVIRTPPISIKGGRIRVFIRNRMAQRPVIDAKLCTKCGTCVDICPVDPKAVMWSTEDKSKPPRHNYDCCIRCYCCQETCPAGAIIVKDTMPGRIFQRLNLVNRV